MDALLDDAAHVVLYSERGRGKTSLANLAVEHLRRRGAIVARTACEAESTFDSIMRSLARDLPASLLAAQNQDPDAVGCEGLLPAHQLRPADIAALPRGLNCPVVILVADEFDRVTDPDTRTRLADTIKLLADRALNLRFMIVGVSETLEQIIGQHPSIQRAIAGVHLPLLTDEEIALMLTRGGGQAGVTFGETATSLVADVALGMPYMAQLLGLRITQSALRRGAAQADDPDMLQAVDRLLVETSPATQSTYARLTASLPGMDAALRHLAAGERDPWARVAVVRAGGHVLVGGRRIENAQWAALLEAGIVAQPDGPTGLAHIRDRLLIYHVQLLAARFRLTHGGGAQDTPVRLGRLAASA